MKATGIFFAVFVAVATAASTKEGAAPIRSSSICEQSKFPYMIADASQCDKFIKCDHMQATEELCEDGFVFEESIQKCDLPFHVDCSKRPNLQPPKGFGNCTRLNGLFEVQRTCDQYFFCRDGEDTLIECAPGLVYDPKQGVCEFPDVAMRPGCMPEEFLRFKCPVRPDGVELTFGDHERHPKPDDCRFFFKCMANGMPRLGGCEITKVYNPETGFCDEPKHVKGCENYYKNLKD